jgi:tetratricopeptide (TPR) repeat protein
MSKPTGLCFPLLLLCWEALCKREGETARRRLGPCWFWGILLTASVATAALAAYSQTHAEGYVPRALFSASLPWRMLNAAVALGLSLWSLIVPTGIYLDYRAVPGAFPLHGVTGLAVCAAALTALAVCGIGAWRKRPGRGVCWLVLGAAAWYLAALAPTLGIFGSFGEQARADRFLYVPSMGVTLGAVAVMGRVRRPFGEWVSERLFRFGEWLLLAAVLAGGIASTWSVLMSYRNDYTAFSRTLAFDPDHGRALAHVASEACARLGRIDRGIALFRRSQALRPRDDTAAQLAYALAMRGRSEDFAEIRRLCAKFACDHRLDRKGQALEALGMTALRQRRWAEAASCLEDSIRAPQRFYSPDDARLRLAAAYCNGGRTREAVRVLKELTRSPRHDIRGKADQALRTLTNNPHALLFFD